MEAIFTKHQKKNIPVVKTGDTVRVHQIIKEGDKERVQVFEGLVIATHGGKTLDGTFTVRKESSGIGVERIFPLHSPRVVKVERIKQSRVRRSKLYFIRNLSGKEARLKELNRDHQLWEEPEAEKELEKIAEETAKEAEAAKTAKKAEEVEMEAKATAALAAHQSGGSGRKEEEKNQPKADQPMAEAEKAIKAHEEVKKEDKAESSDAPKEKSEVGVPTESVGKDKE